MSGFVVFVTTFTKPSKHLILCKSTCESCYLCLSEVHFHLVSLFSDISIPDLFVCLYVSLICIIFSLSLCYFVHRFFGFWSFSFLIVFLWRWCQENFDVELNYWYFNDFDFYVLSDSCFFGEDASFAKSLQRYTIKWFCSPGFSEENFLLSTEKMCKLNESRILFLLIWLI